jgi:hypothetical protein
MDRAPALERRPLWRRLLKPTLVIAALMVAFGWLLPRFIDYEQVWDALTELDSRELAVLLGLGLARVPTEALMYRAFLPGLGLRRGSEAYLSSNFAGQLLPPPSASVVQYGYFRGGGYPPDAAGLAAMGSFLFPTIARFLLPLVAAVLMLLTGEITGSIAIAAGLSLVVTAVAGISGFFFLRGEHSARWLGAKAARPLSWIMVKLRREPIEDVAGQAATLRTKRSPSCARAGRWGRSGRQPTSSSPTSSCWPRSASSASRRLSSPRPRRLPRSRAPSGPGRCSRSRAAAWGWWTPSSSPCSSSWAAPPTTRSWPRPCCGASSTRSSRCRSARSR